MSAIIKLTFFAMQFGVLCLVWRFTTDHNKRDFIFWVIGIMLAAQNSRFIGSVIITQMRYLFIPMMIAAIAFRGNLLRKNLGLLAWLYLLLTVTIFMASGWSQYPGAFFKLKLHRTIYAILMVLMAGTLRTEADIRKVLWAIFPNIVLLAVGLQVGTHETVGLDERLSINELNSNSIGVYSGYVVFSAVLIFIFIRTNLLVKIIVSISALSGIAALLGSGSRTAFASCVGASMIAGIALLTNRKRMFTLGMPLLTVIAIFGYRVWSNVSYSVAERLTMIATGGVSSRDVVWLAGFDYLRQQHLWFGMGGIEQGFFVKRLDFLMAPGLNWGSTLNIYIDAILETGVLGLILWFLILLVFISRSFCLWLREKTIYRYVPIAMCMFGLLQGVGESMSYRAEHPAGMLMVLGMVILSARRFQWEGAPQVFRRPSGMMYPINSSGRVCV